MSEGKAYLASAGVVALFLGAVYWLTSENDEDLARKPELVNAILTQSMQNCDLQNEYTQTASYEDRLREVLTETRSVSLDFILANTVTVCLDQRLSHLEEGFFDTNPHALYYPTENIIALYDNGDDYENRDMFGISAISYSDGLLNQFNRSFDQDELSTIDNIQFGYSYKRNKNGRKYVWQDNAEEYAIIQSNPELLNPPINE